MFVAGIEIFFGFVAGAILLIVALSIGASFFYAATAVITGIHRFIKRHPLWIMGGAIYPVVIALLFSSDSYFGLYAASVMIVAGLIGLLVLFFVLDARRSKSASASSAK